MGEIWIEEERISTDSALESLKNQIVEVKVCELEQKFLSKDADFFVQVDRSKKYKSGEILNRLLVKLAENNLDLETSKKYKKFYAYIKDNTSFTC